MGGRQHFKKKLCYANLDRKRGRVSRSVETAPFRHYLIFSNIIFPDEVVTSRTGDSDVA